ncbi:MAG: FHA domain-containing protein [Deltaproteobacteria bacterium]|nr:FHA domain-containing protein [Deltaproteobacteria bacterium]
MAGYRLTVLGRGNVRAPSAIDFREDVAVIGRSELADLPLTTPSISRRHAAIWVENGSPYIRDLGSRLGTFVNDERVTDPRPLNDGDRVRLGTDVYFMVVSRGGILEAEEDMFDEPTAAPDDHVTSSLVELALADSTGTRVEQYYDAISELASRLDLVKEAKDIYRLALEAIERCVDAERYLAFDGRDPASLELCARVPAFDDQGDEVWPSAELLTQALVGGKAVNSFDTPAESRGQGGSGDVVGKVRSALCVGVSLGGRALGAIYVDNSPSEGLFDGQSAEFVRTVAHVAAGRLFQLRTLNELAEMRYGKDGPDLSDALTSLAKEIHRHAGRLESLAESIERQDLSESISGVILDRARRLREEVDRCLEWSQNDDTSGGSGPSGPSGPSELSGAS